MENRALKKLKYPIGEPELPEEINDALIENWIGILESLPAKLEALVTDLNDEQLNMPYRPEGWTVRQVIHHIADSHHHSYTRFKWALTENEPVIKAYEEKEWSKIFDARTAPIELSLDYIKALHAKMVYLLKGLASEDLKKCYVHPDGNIKVSVEENIYKYAWHSDHHYAHIENLLIREGWKV